MDNLSNLIIPKFIDSAITPVAKGAGERHADIVNIVCTPIVIARRYKDIALNTFLNKTEKKLKSIPENEICNPPVNIVGPIIDLVHDMKWLKIIYMENNKVNKGGLSKAL